MSEMPLTTDAAQTALWAAYARAQANIEGAKKESTDGHFDRKYADLGSVTRACLAAFNAEGIAFIQVPRTFRDEKGGWHVEINCVVAHAGGGVFSPAPLLLPVSKPDAQGIGSAITYGRRYQLASLTGVAPFGDDGNAAVGNGQRQPAQSVQRAAEAVASESQDEERLNLMRMLRLAASRGLAAYQEAWSKGLTAAQRKLVGTASHVALKADASALDAPAQADAENAAAEQGEEAAPAAAATDE